MGGIERYTYYISRSLLQKGYKVIVITSQYKDSLLNEETLDGIKIYRLPVKRIAKNRYPFLKKNKLYKQLLEKIKTENIDYYVSNTRFQFPAILGTELAAEVGKKSIVIEHGTGYLTFDNPLIDFFLRRIERYLVAKVKKNTDLFYGVSKQSATWLKEFDIQAKGELYNAVEASEFEKYYQSENKKKKIVLSYSGRLIKKVKGIEKLLSVFEALSKEFDNLELFICGDGPLYKKICIQYQNENIHFLGVVSHDKVMEINNRSDIFVLLSKVEGFSTSMLEAAMLGNVVITSDVGGAKELIPNEDYGYVIENSEEVLLTTLRELIAHPEKMRSIQEKITKRVLENYTWDKTVAAFEKAFDDTESN